MSQNLQQLISTIGTHVARNIVQEQIVYPRTDKLSSDSGIVEVDFDGTLLEVIQKIENNIELKAIDAVKDSEILLKMMEEFKEAILLDQADYVLIYKGGFDVLKLRNIKYPKSGRSLYIELNSARNELIRYIETTRGRHYHWAETASMMGVCIITFFTLLNAWQRK